MSKKANPTLIGAFVMGAAALLVAGIVSFGSGRFLQRTFSYVGLFEGSVKGLSVGAPVSFRGIQVGSVASVVGLVDSGTKNLYVAVFMEFVPRGKDTAIVGKGADISRLSGPKFMDYLIREQGLRAQLQVQSLLTNQLYVALVLQPDTPIRLAAEGLELGVPEIPTMQSSLQRLTRTVETLPLEDIAAEFRNTIRNIDRFVSGPELERIVTNLAEASEDLKQVLATINADAPRAMDDLGGALASARGAMEQVRSTLSFEQGVPGEVAGNLNGTLRAATTTLQQAERTLAFADGEPRRIARDLRRVLGEAHGTLEDLRDLFRDDSPLRQAITELAEAARSFRVFADYLERHPEALLKGKQGY